MLPAGLVVAFGWLLAQSAAAQISGTVRTIDGRELVGSLSVAAGGAATIAGEAGETQFDVAEMVSFERAGSETRNVAAEHRVWLRSGAELPAKKLSGRPAVDGKPAVLIARLPSGLDVELPISMLRAVRQGGLMRPQPTLFASDLGLPPANNDLLYVVKGGQSQRSAVTIKSLTAKTVDFELRGDEYEFELSGVAAMVFGANTGFPPDRQRRPRTVLVLTTGERIEGKLIEVGKMVRCRLDEGCVLAVPPTDVHRLEVSSDKLVWLSSLAPEVVQTPAFDRVWPWHKDRSIAGEGFELAGEHHERGIGMVPHTRLTYDLQGRFDVFEATIGIDDRGGPEAHAIFRVFVDGKQMFESQPMTRGQKPEALRVALNKAKSMAIEVDFGKNYDLGDFCAFANARVVQQ